MLIWKYVEKNIDKKHCKEATMITSKDFLSSDTTVYASGADNRNAENRYPSPKNLSDSGIKLTKEENKISIPTAEASR
jgi:hypothetical protein